jgi:hypothetical protein
MASTDNGTTAVRVVNDTDCLDIFFLPFPYSLDITNIDILPQ